MKLKFIMNTFFYCIFLLYISKIPYSFGLTCIEIHEYPDDHKFSLQDLKSTPPKEMVECLAHLSKEKLQVEEADYIWKSLVSYYEGVGNVPENILIQLHWVTPALQPEDYENITLCSIDVVQNFGLNYGLSSELLAIIADRVREDFAGKEPEDYTFYDLGALRQILCAFNKSEILRIRPAAYKETSSLLGKLENCSPDVLQGFAVLAVQQSAFGPPSKWTKSILDTIGVVADYIPKQFLNNIESDEESEPIIIDGTNQPQQA